MVRLPGGPLTLVLPARPGLPLRARCRFRAPAPDKGFGDVRSKIQAALREAVGPAAHHFRIAADPRIKKQGGHSRPVCLNVPAERISLAGLEGWRRQLKAALRQSTG